jgi:hypothetical protein
MAIQRGAMALTSCIEVTGDRHESHRQARRVGRRPPPRRTVTVAHAVGQRLRHGRLADAARPGEHHRATLRRPRQLIQQLLPATQLDPRRRHGVLCHDLDVLVDPRREPRSPRSTS